ncbi:MAG: hypothetical protein IJF32_06415, partial [Oscillospiraceae bacterium]|nr:hypothetical protein [Oscillospiraceae bacterium]
NSLKVGEAIVRTTADPTMQNVIKFLQGSEITGTSGSSWANSELSLISYRSLNYYNYRVTAPRSETAIGANDWNPVRKFSEKTTVLFDSTAEKSSGYETDNAGVAKVYTMPSVLASNTAPFEMFGKNNTGMSHSFLNNGYYYATFNLGTKTTPVFESVRGTFQESFFAIRIKIPENATAERYQLRVGNTYKKDATAGTYNDPNASECEVYMTKIGSDGFEGKFKNATGNLFGFVDASGKDLAYSAIAAPENKLIGTYTSKGMSSDTFENILSLTPGEEYLLYFRIADGSLTDESIKKEAAVANNLGKVFVSGSTLYQNFKISYIDLVPVTEDVAPELASAELAYDEETMTASVTSAKMNDGTAATGYTVTYGINSAKGATISSTGVVTPGTDDETVSVYADVTLDGKTVRATVSDIKLLGKEPGQLKYRISTDFINDAAYETIVNLATPNYAISNAEITFISWKDMYYTKTGSTIARATAETTDLAPITNILSPDTDKYELPGRHSADNAPRLESAGFISQFRAQGYDAEEKEKADTNAYMHRYKTGRPHYAIKLYIPQKGAYELSLKNNFTPAIGADFVGSGFFTSSNNAVTSKGYEAMTEIYFAKADYGLNYVNGQGILSGTGAEAYLVDDNKIGWYDSGRYGETQTYDGKYLVVPEAGEYFLILTVTPESLEKNPDVHHRTHTDATTGAVTGYQDYQLFLLSEIKLTPASEDSDYTASFNAKESTYTTNGTATVNTYAYTDGGELIETLVTGATVT